MGKILSLLLIVSFLCMGMMNAVATHVVDNNDNIIERHSPFYVGSKPFEEYEQPGFVCGFVDGNCFFTYGFYPPESNL